MIIRDTYYLRSENINFRDRRGRNNPCCASERERVAEGEGKGEGKEGAGTEIERVKSIRHYGSNNRFLSLLHRN